MKQPSYSKLSANLESLQTLTALFANAEIIDLSVLLERGIPRWPSHPHLVIDPTVTHEHDGYYCQSISLAEHTGTHVDAPHHIHADMPDRTIEHVPLESLVGPCTVIDLSDRDWQPGESATLRDIETYLERHGAQIETGDIVLINYGWLRRYWTTGGSWKYYVDNQPGLTAEVADELIRKQVKAVGTDTSAVGTPVKDGRSELCHFHQRVLREEIYLIETLDQLDRLPAKCFFMTAPLKIHRGSGSPIRAMAVVPR